MKEVLLIINAGSSNIKFSLFSCEPELKRIYHGQLDKMCESPCLTVSDTNNVEIFKKNVSSTCYHEGLESFLTWFAHSSNALKLKAVGHRVVHGGKFFTKPVLVSEDVLQKISDLIPLAPLHQPHNLQMIKSIQAIYPDLPQVVCCDTTFHHTQERLATLFAIPHSLTEAGIVRYGFHGISYEYIASIMSTYTKKTNPQRVIVAHLGNGSSMCAMYQGKSVSSTMGLTTLDGLMMGTRCGQIDPGILLYLLQEKHYSPSQLENLLYNESGLLGVSGISHDVRLLELNEDSKAKEAIDLFCYRAALEFGSLVVALNGCDTFIFTGGIGEHSAIIRKKICEKLTWLGIHIDDEANEHKSTIISRKDSIIEVCVIPTDEEYMIAKHTRELTHA